MKQPNIKLNPQPKMRYEVTLAIEDAPGSFDTVEVTAGYVVKNDRCVPLTPGSGATLAPEKYVPLVLTRVSDKVYKGDFFIDLLQDEDYYGLGVCQWSLTFVSAHMEIGNVSFSPFISLEDILAGNSVTRYFNRRSYFSEDARSKKDDRPRISDGRENRSDFEQDSKNTFSTTLTAKEKFQ